MIWIENNNSLQIQTKLMFMDIPVANLEIDFSAYTVGINSINIINNEKLPLSVQTDSVSLFDWLLSRCLIMKNHRNIFFARLPTTTETRDFRLPFILSLTTNSISLADKYWLNPNETVEIVCNGAKIVFETKTWIQADPFKNVYVPGILEQYGLNDMFCIDLPDEISARSLIWSTSGSQNKRWMLDKDGYVLEKKLSKSAFDDELKTMDFFLLNGVLIPEYNHYVKKLSFGDETHIGSFGAETINESLHVIQKRCITNSDSYLERLIDYIKNDNNIEIPIARMCKANNVGDIETKYFIDSVREYQKKFNIEDGWLDTKNIGLFINKCDAQPVVWGRLQMRRNWIGQIDT